MRPVQNIRIGFSAGGARHRPLQAAVLNIALQSERNSLFGWLDIHIRIFYIQTSVVEQQTL